MGREQSSATSRTCMPTSSLPPAVMVSQLFCTSQFPIGPFVEGNRTLPCGMGCDVQVVGCVCMCRFDSLKYM